MREGAHEAAIDADETGRNASAPASEPAANGSQPPPDPVREALVREGAHEAAIDIVDTGRIASAPASGPSANGSQPHPVAGCLRTGTNARLHTPTRSHRQKGPLFRPPVRTLRKICKHESFLTRIEGDSVAVWLWRTTRMLRTLQYGHAIEPSILCGAYAVKRYLSFGKVVGDDGKGYEYNSARLGDGCVVHELDLGAGAIAAAGHNVSRL